MRAKSFLATGALFLSLTAMGSAKTWDVTIESPTRAGNIVLPAGNYRIKLDHNNQPVFEAPDTGKRYRVPVKIEQVPQKYDQTAVETRQEGATQVIQSIDLGGTTDKLEFTE